jgi:uncharacterized membrane protein
LLALRSLGFYRTLFFAYVGAALVMFTALVPPFQKADEPAHYLRSVSLANLDLVCDRSPEGEYYFTLERRYADLPDVMHYWEVWHRRERFDWRWLRHDFSGPAYREQVRVFRWCSLPPSGYVPNAVGVLLGKPFVNPLVGFYMGRAFGALFFFGALVLSLRIVPERYRLAVYLYAGLPTVLHQVSAISYDAVQLSLFPLLFATFARLALPGERPRPVLFLAFVGLLAWTVNIKLLAYLPLLFLVLAVAPVRVAVDFRRYLQLALGGMAATIFLTGLIALLYLPRAEDSGPGDYEVNASEQVRYVLEDPWRFIVATYNALARYGEHLIGGSIGYFGWIVDYGMGYLPYYAVTVIAAVVVYLTVMRETGGMRPHQLVALAAAVGGTSLAIALSLYAVWSPVGGDMVHGLQGRYFVGLLPFVVMLTSQTAASVGKGNAARALLAVVALMVLYNIFRAIEIRHL